jgi:four helix bundle protein
MGVKSHEDLRVWRSAMDLAARVYRFTTALPEEERFGLRSQMRRAAVSIASNIAEGAARNSSAELRHFLSNSLGSLAELETQYLLCINLGLLAPEVALQQHIKVTRVMLARLRASIGRKRAATRL